MAGGEWYVVAKNSEYRFNAPGDRAGGFYCDPGAQFPNIIYGITLIQLRVYYISAKSKPGRINFIIQISSEDIR